MKLSHLLKRDALALLIVMVPFLVLPFIWSQAPDRIPMQWGMDGEPTWYGGKTLGLLFIPVVNALLYLLFVVLPAIDPKRKLKHEQKPLPAIRFVIMLGLMILYFLQVAVAMEVTPAPGSRLVLLVVTALFLVLGNYMASIQPNYFIGFRTPWTLEDADIWKKTHRVGSRIWVAVSGLLLILWFFVEPGTYNVLFGIGVGIMALYPLGYSYYLYAGKKPSTTSQT